MNYLLGSRVFLILTISLFLCNVIVAQKSINYDVVYTKAELSYKRLIQKLNIPVIEINLDEIKAESIFPKIIIDGDKAPVNDKYYLAWANGLVAHKDTLFILDENQNNILVCNFEGKILKTIGREGGGPGEFRSPWLMAENFSYFFVYDLKNGRIQIFNKKFKYLKSIAISFPPSGRSITANKDYLLVNQKSDVPFDITSYSLKNLSLTKSNFIDGNFAFEGELKNYNWVYEMQLDASSEKYISAVTSLLPYVFIFDNTGKPIYSIKYKSKKTTELMRNNQVGHFNQLINGIKVAKNNLFLFMPKKIIVWDIPKKAPIVCFNIENAGANIFELFGNTLFLSLRNKVYKVKINY